MANTPQPFDSTYFDSPYFNPAEAANVAADPATRGQYDFSDLQIVPATLANATVGFPYVGNITLTGGFEPYDSLSIFDGAGNITSANLIFSVDPINLANANISGISNAAQTVTFTVQGTETFGNLPPVVTSQLYNLNVVVPNITVGPASLPNPSVGTFYTQTFTSANGAGNITFSNIGALPSGLTLVSATGNLSGIVNSNTTPVNFTIVATDAYNSVGNTSYSVTIDQPVITLAPTIAADGVVGVAYNETITATGGIAPYTYSVTGGTLPANLTLGFNTGNITGTPTANGLSNFTITAYDLYQSPGNRSYTPTIALPVITFTPTTLSNAVTGQYLLRNIVASGGTGPYTYAVTSNALPANLTLTTSGTLSGIINAPGTANFTITATDSYNSTGNIAYTLITEPIVLVVGPASIPNGTCGIPYSVQFFTSAGIEPYTFSLTAGSLPPGLVLNPLTGVLSGICLDDGTYSFTITATDSYLNSGSNSYTTTFVASILPASLPNPTERRPYTQILSTIGGVAPYTFALDSGTLPPGLSLIDNLITGVPTTPGPYSFIISSTDSVGTVITRSYSVTVLPQPPIVLLPQDNILPKARVNFSYTETFVAQGGTAPYTYTVTSGTLPTGLTLNSNTGVLSGIVTQDGLISFKITATDAADFSISKFYQLPVLTYPDIPNEAIRVYVGGVLQTSGYTVTSKTPATVAFTTPPPEGVSVTIAILQGYTWYRNGLLTASDGVPLQEQTTPDAIFLQGN